MRFRLSPTPEQEIILLRHCAAARFAWNLGLEQRSQWRDGRPNPPGWAAQCKQLTEARAENEWLRSQPQIVQVQALKDLDQAYQTFFAKKSGYPTWRKAGQHEGFRIVGDSRTWRVERLNRRWARVLVPKVGWIKFHADRALTSGKNAPKSYRITMDRRGRWHVAFALIPPPIPTPRNGEIVGIDRGVTVSAALSTGELLDVPGLRAGEEQRLLRLQRRLARAKKGSNRRKRVVRQIATIKGREADRRKDWVEKISTDVARRFDLIGLERLPVQQMTKSAKGTVEKPGANVRQKAGLNREILKNGWGMLRTRLEQKAPERVVLVRAAYTSQMCNACGHVWKENRESQAVFLCTACGHEAHADVNAAKNVRDLAVAAHSTTGTSSTAGGQFVAGRGDMAALGRSAKRQPSKSHAPSRAA